MSRGFVAAVLLVSGLSAGCGSSSSSTPSSPTPTPTPASTGSLQVGIAAGHMIPGTGYTVTVDGSMTQSGQTDNRVTFSGLSAGDHMVGLSIYSTQCTAAGENPRTVTVVAGTTVTTQFDAMCTTAAPSTQPTR